MDRDTAYLLPPSVQERLPEGHLGRYVVDVVEALDLSGLVRQYAGRGSDAHHPGRLLALLIYGDATGVHASRAIERASYDSVAFRFVAGNTPPTTTRSPPSGGALRSRSRHCSYRCCRSRRRTRC